MFDELRHKRLVNPKKIYPGMTLRVIQEHIDGGEYFLTIATEPERSVDGRLFVKDGNGFTIFLESIGIVPDQDGNFEQNIFCYHYQLNS